MSEVKEMDSDRLIEVMSWWYKGEHEKCIRTLLEEADKFNIGMACLDVLEQQGKEWLLYFIEYLGNVDNPSAIQNYPPDR